MRKKISPFVRIRNKNITIREQRGKIKTLSILLGCGEDGTIDEIIKAVMNLQVIEKSFMDLTVEHQKIIENREVDVQNRVGKLSFDLELKNKHLEGLVESMKSSIEDLNKKNKLLREKPRDGRGFWDFVYKLFNIQ